jgi:DNA polymerase-3 subunit gamma/tau
MWRNDSTVTNATYLRDGLKAGDIQAMLDVADAMDERSLSFESALQELATLFHRIALLQFAPQALADDAERARLAPYAEAFDAEFLQLCYQIAIHGRDEIGLAPDEFAGFTMTLLRLFAFRPDAGAGGKVGARAAEPRPAPARAPGAPAAPAAPAARDGGVSPRLTLVDEPAADDWHALAARLKQPARQLAQHCELVERAGGMLRLRLDPAHKHLMSHQDKLRTALSELWGELRLEITLAAPLAATPATRANNEKRERQEKAVAAIEGDPFVRDVMDLFDASIDESTIKPL